MFNDAKKRIKKISETKLLSAEKNSIRESLVSYMQFHPVRAGATSRLLMQRSFIFEVISYRKVMPIALVVALLLSGSVSYAAENSLPGDVLYPVKVSVNEEVRQLVAINAEAKANWEGKRAGRRLEEAEKLALAGELKADVIARLEERFEKHAQNVEDKIVSLAEEGDVEKASKLSANFEASLEAHDKVIDIMSSSSVAASEDSAVGIMSMSLSAPSESRTKVAIENENPNLLNLGVMVKNKAETAERLRETLESKISEKPVAEAKLSAEGKIVAAENKIASTKKFIELKKSVIGEEGYVKAMLKITEAEKSVVDAKAELLKGDNEKSFALAGDAIKIAQKAKSSIELHLTLDQMVNIKSIINGEAPTEAEINPSGESGETPVIDANEEVDVEIDGTNSGGTIEGNGRIDVNLGL